SSDLAARRVDAKVVIHLASQGRCRAVEGEMPPREKRGAFGGNHRVQPVAGNRSELEPDTLRQGQLPGVVDSRGLAPHVPLPGVGAALAPAAGVLLAAEGAADLGAGGADVDVGDAAVRADGAQEGFG